VRAPAPAALAPAIKYLLIVGGIVGATSVLGTAAGTILGAYHLFRGRDVKWADWIGVAGGLGALFGVGVVIGTALTTGLD
jgi:hypothetical protein